MGLDVEQLLLVVVILVGALFLMFGARILGAERQGYGAALLVTVLSAVIGFILEKLVPNDTLSMIIGFVLSTVITAKVLGTSFLKAFFISVLSGLLLAGLIFLVALVGGIAIFGSGAH